MEPIFGSSNLGFYLRQMTQSVSYTPQYPEVDSNQREARVSDRSDQNSSSPTAKNPGDSSRPLSSDNNLTEEERRQVEKLSQRDKEVRAHEQAHIAAGGSYVRGGANYQYERGPDGKLYAVGGEVSIDASPIPNNPAATIRKMETVVRAALAPSQPSGQDYQVAAKAQMEISQAQMELMKKRGKEAYGTSGNFQAATPTPNQSGNATAISLIA